MAAPRIAITPKIIPDNLSDNAFIGGAAICLTLDKKDKKPNTEFLTEVGNNSTPYKNTIMNDIRKNVFEIQAVTTFSHPNDDDINIVISINKPDKKLVVIKKVLRFNIFKRNVAATVPGNRSSPDIATLAWMLPLIFPIYCETQ